MPAYPIVLVYVVLDSVVLPIFRPLGRWFAKLALIQRLEAFVARLPPYVVLVVLAIPFAVAEPAKIVALYVIGSGHWVLGAAMLVGAYLISILVVERIYRGGEAQLRKIAWVAWLLDRLGAIRDRLVAWIKATRLWQAASGLAKRLIHRG